MISIDLEVVKISWERCLENIESYFKGTSSPYDLPESKTKERKVLT